MKSESLFNRLICVDALLSFNGVIPSLPEFQLKLVTLIELFSKLLISEGEDELLCDRLCHLLCRHLDRHIALSLSTENICWARYSLTRHFYGYEEAREEISAELAQLLEIATGTLYACASKLHKLVSVSKKADAFAALPEVAGEKEAPVAEVKIASLRPVPFPLWATIVALTGVLAVLWFICLCYLKSFDL